MREFAADLHIHSALSPCAAEEMSPPAIVEKARAAGLDLIAVCDHNSARNAAAVQQAAGDGPAVIAGIEITTAEEVHLVGLFPDAAAARAAGAEVEATLPPYTPSRHFARPRVMDAAGRIVESLDLMLSAASAFPLDAAVELIHRHGGLAVPAHVDRPSFSLLSQLGFFPEQARFDAIELSAHGVREGRQRDLLHHNLPVVASSDSHNLCEIGACRTVLKLAAPDFASLAANFRHPALRRALLA